MRIIIEFKTNNAAFVDHFGYEFKRVLDQVNDRIYMLHNERRSDGPYQEYFDDYLKPGEFSIRDSNGNRIGSVTVSEE